MIIGKKDFDVENQCYIMGILNVTPDSFSDGGKFNHMDRALARVEQMLADGMDILDIGGESTRPGYILLSDAEEIERVVPVIGKIKSNFDVPISVDTYKAGVAEAALLAGADLINDIWGLKYKTDAQEKPEMADIIAKYQVPCCLMHNRKEAVYKDFITDVIKDLKETLELAEKAGIDKNKIILDPGVGFGKTYEHNLEILAKMEVMDKLGCPWLLGCSRKSVIGLTLDLPADQRLEGTLATSVMAVMAGYSFVRVHDVKENARAVKFAQAVKRFR